jgi:hypothetical protein
VVREQRAHVVRALSASGGPEKGVSNGKETEQHLENATPTL